MSIDHDLLGIWCVMNLKAELTVPQRKDTILEIGLKDCWAAALTDHTMRAPASVHSNIPDKALPAEA